MKNYRSLPNRIRHALPNWELGYYRKACRKTQNRFYSGTKVVDFTIGEFSKITTLELFRQSRKEEVRNDGWNNTNVSPSVILEGED